MSVFIDTGILVRAHEERASEKHLIAYRLVRELWQLPVLPVISVQVCKELWRVLSRSRGRSREETAHLVENYLQWRVIAEDAELLAAAFALRREYDLPVWDSCIVAAAQRARVRQLWTEQIAADRPFGDLQVVNPLVR